MQDMIKIVTHVLKVLQSILSPSPLQVLFAVARYGTRGHGARPCQAAEVQGEATWKQGAEDRV